MAISIYGYFCSGVVVIIKCSNSAEKFKCPKSKISHKRIALKPTAEAEVSVLRVYRTHATMFIKRPFSLSKSEK